MKIKKIIDLCKKSRMVYLFDNESDQWLSSGAAMYPLFGLPHFTPEGLCVAFDIKSSQQEKMHFRHEKQLPTMFSINEIEEHEQLINSISGMALYYAGKVLLPYETSEGIAFIDGKYLEPFEDVNKNQFELYERRTTAGQMYFVAKTGFIVVGVMLPEKVINVDFCEKIQSLYQRCKVALFNEKSSEESTQQGLFGGNK